MNKEQPLTRLIADIECLHSGNKGRLKGAYKVRVLLVLNDINRA
jgi:hypothetical protein